MPWTRHPQSVLVLRHHTDNDDVIPYIKMITWLAQEKNLTVLVEHQELSNPLIAKNDHVTAVRSNLIRFTKDPTERSHQTIDFIITLGGDGALLQVSSLFQTNAPPPVMAFNLDYPGFLTPFQFDADFKKHVTKAMEGTPSVIHHERLRCDLVGEDGMSLLKQSKSHASNGYVKSNKLVLNDIVVDRGCSPYLSKFEIYIEDRFVTLVQGDGLILSTPTGSTAYALSAGASIVHPDVPCILITPICPHSLSFRPIVIPAGVQIKVVISSNSHCISNKAMVSFDGRDKVEMTHSDVLLVTTAAYPVTTICSRDKLDDWFDSLALCLNWNVRRPQKPLEIPNKSIHQSIPSSTASTTVS